MMIPELKLFLHPNQFAAAVAAGFVEEVEGGRYVHKHPEIEPAEIIVTRTIPLK